MRVAATIMSPFDSTATKSLFPITEPPVQVLPWSTLLNNPAEVAAILAVGPKTPIRSDTTVTLDYAGLTGIASVSLKGNLGSAPPLKPIGDELPTLRAQTASGDMSLEDMFLKLTGGILEREMEGILGD